MARMARMARAKKIKIIKKEVSKMRKLNRSLILWLLVTLGLVWIPARGTTYKESAAGACSDPDADPDAKGFYDKIDTFTDWDVNYYAKYSNCVESQYASGSNNEGSYIDLSHIHYHVGHGGSHADSGNNDTKLTAIVFDGDSLTDDQTYLDASEAQGSWGDDKLDWIAFRCCKLLNDTSWKYWAKTMNGLHLILGFYTVSTVDDNFGKTWADKMQTQTIAQAWFSTVDSSQPFYVTARVIGETDECYKDYLHGMGSVSDDPTPDDTKSTWLHFAGVSFVPIHAGNLQGIIRQVVIQRVINAATVRLIGQAFGFGPNHDVEESGDYYSMSRTDGQGPDPMNPGNPSHILYVYKNSGIYYYQNLGRLWRVDLDNPPGIYPASSAPARAYQFLTDPSHINLYPDDVHEYYVNEDVITIENINSGEPETFQVHRCVNYSRELPAETGTMASVVGPGAKLKVYIDEDGGIIGAMGNWRETQTAGMVNIISKVEAWNRFVQYGQEAVLNPIYLEYDNVQTDMNTATIGYYEASCLENQSELIPVWIFNTRYYKNGDLIETVYTYIPAATSPGGSF